jgi:hypothetical protein
VGTSAWAVAATGDAAACAVAAAGDAAATAVVAAAWIVGWAGAVGVPPAQAATVIRTGTAMSEDINRRLGRA